MARSWAVFLNKFDNPYIAMECWRFEFMSSEQSYLMSSFDYQPRTRLVYGVDRVDQVGELAKEMAATRVLVVTDSGIVAAGHLDRVRDSLVKVGLEVAVFSKVEENPTTRCVQRCVEVAREEGVDLLIGLGGGSSMDTAKGCNFILTNGGEMKDYWGVGKATRPMLPLIAIPTTSGTGSECQSFALIADELTHAKMACGDPKAAARVAILDPGLTLSQPRRVTACTGIDAVTHAVETAVTTKRNPLSLLYSHRAFQMLAQGFPEVWQDPRNVEARGKMLLGAAFAGTAIENSMLGVAHSVANPLTAHFNIIHGEAVGMMMPHVVRFNGAIREVCLAYRDLALAGHLVSPDAAPEEALECLVETLNRLLVLGQMPQRLRERGVTQDKIPQMAEEASKQWTAHFNPRKASIQDFVSLYESAW